MNKMIYILIALNSLSIANTQDFDPKNCSKIDDVIFSHKVEIGENQYTLTSEENTIHLSPKSYTVNGTNMNLDDSQLYYDLFTDFLSQSKDYSKILANSNMSLKDLKNFNIKQMHGKNDYQEVIKGSVKMCRTILDIAAINNLENQNNSSFVEAVQIDLK